MAAGDFNGDGFGDLAIGAPGDKDIDARDTRGGTVTVLLGSRAGLTARGSRLFGLATPGVPGISPRFAGAFGAVLAAGNLGRGQEADLAIGTPIAAVPWRGGLRQSAGQVNVIYGSRSGLRVHQGQRWAQGHGLGDQPESGNGFGSSLTIANFGRGRAGDLAIGVPGENRRGQVHVLYGTGRGLVRGRSEVWHEGRPGVRGNRVQRARFGQALAAANFGRSGQADLAVGIPFAQHKVGRFTVGDGAVQVIYGSRGGLTAAGDQRWSQHNPGIRSRGDTGQIAEAFGNALAAGRVDRGKYADLAVGVCAGRQGANREFFEVLGEVNLMRGSRRGLTARGDELWTQNSRGVPDQADFNDNFACDEGRATGVPARPLAIHDFGKSARADLAVGAFTEDPFSRVSAFDAGAVNVIYGARRGLHGRGAQIFHQSRRGPAQ